MSCSSCKKKKPITKLPDLEVAPAIPTQEDIKSAYFELTNMSGIKKEYREKIKNIYKFLFDEELDLDCGGCASRQVRKFHNYLKDELKII